MINRQQFIKSLLYFRKVMCSKKYNLKEKELIFQGLSQDYLRCNLKESDITIFKALCTEWEMRSLYEVMR